MEDLNHWNQCQRDIAPIVHMTEQRGGVNVRGGDKGGEKSERGGGEEENETHWFSHSPRVDMQASLKS